MTALQEWIHRLEEGAGTRWVRVTAVVLGFWALALVYNLFEFRNLATQEGMDLAQLARNIARGNGYSTQFVRPLSLALVEQRERTRGQRTNDLARVKEAHPDLAHPPVYPLLLAGAMKILPFEYSIPDPRSFWRHQPDLLIALLNQALLFVLMGLVYGLAKRLFDASVAAASAVLLAGTELLWRFSISGLPTILLMILFVLLVGCLAAMERAARDGGRGRWWWASRALAAGLLVGVGTLTSYAFGWLLLPVLVFVVVWFPGRRLVLSAVVLLTFAAVVGPWVARNQAVSGRWFGTAGYALVQGLPDLEGERTERSLHVPSIDNPLRGMTRKLVVNAEKVVQQDLPRLGGSWLTAFFLVGLMLPFLDAGRSRVRWFVVSALAVLVPVQVLGRTYLSEDVAHVNSENVLVWVTPLVLVYGVVMFFTLADRLPLGLFRARQTIVVLFVLAMSLPLILALLPPRKDARVHPPYYPPFIQQFCRWMDPTELIMADLPWAVAWYGDRQSVWLTWWLRDDRAGEDFYAVNDLRKPVRALYLTHRTLDQRFFSELQPSGQSGKWGSLVLGGLVVGKMPEGFPLRHAPSGYPHLGHLFLTDRARWREPGK
jgi:hypothetical protein